MIKDRDLIQIRQIFLNFPNSDEVCKNSNWHMCFKSISIFLTRRVGYILLNSVVLSPFVEMGITTGIGICLVRSMAL